MVKLGDKVRDKISGFEGIVVGRTDWLYSCVTCGVKSQKTNKNGIVDDAQWFDEPQLEVVREEIKPEKRPNGGPTRIPGRNSLRGGG